MNMQDFADALASKNVERYSSWFAEDMRLYVPVYEEPMVRKQAACHILPVVFSLFDNFHYPDVFTGQQTHALVFRAEITGIPLEGVDYLRIDESGLVKEFSVTMRPLKAITVAALVSTIIFNVPVNLATGGWSADNPPEDWKQMRNHWELFQGVRSWLLLIGFILQCGALSLQG